MLSSGVPSGSSTNPVFLILPTSENTLVPELFSVPVFAKNSPPRYMITGTLHHDSTLLIFVGFPQSPFCAGYGGRGLERPAWPSIEDIRAVSSPQTKAPAPSTHSMS